MKTNSNFQILKQTVIVMSLMMGATSATLGQHSTVHQLPGLALAEKTAEIAPVVNQQLVTVHVTEGQTVTKGQLMATLEYGVSRAEFEAAKAIADDRSGVNIAQIDVAQAQSRLERFQVALSTGAGNEMELNQAKDELKKALAILSQEESLLVRAKKTAETAAARVEGYIIRAPFAGIVTQQHVSVGNLVEAGMPVFSIVSANHLRVEMNLPLELFGKLEGGKTYEMTGGAPVSQHIKAKLKFVSPMIDSASQSFRCVFVIDNQDMALPAGFPIQLSDQQVTKLLESRNANSAVVQN